MTRYPLLHGNGTLIPSPLRLELSVNAIFQKSDISLICCLLFVVSAYPAEAQQPLLAVGGLVQSPMNLTLSDLQQFNRMTIPADRNTAPKGKKALSYGAVPLRALLDLAKTLEPIQELVISVKNDRGEQLVLSGRELTRATRNRVYIAVSGNVRDTSARGDFPVLVLADGSGYQPAIKRITFIEAISTAQLKAQETNSLKVSFPAKITGKLVQTKSVQGYPLLSVLNQVSVHPEQTDVLRITARSGNAIVSFGELRSAAGPVVVPRNAQDGDKTGYSLLFSRRQQRSAPAGERGIHRDHQPETKGHDVCRRRGMRGSEAADAGSSFNDGESRRFREQG